MIKLMDNVDKFEASMQEKQDWIMQVLVTEFSDDKNFLRKVNKVTFGLMSGE